MTHALLVGNPNCGKTTLFNALTAQNQRVGNWPGVTVEKKTGTIQTPHQTMTLTDLPGLYSLSVDKEASLDEQVTIQALTTMPADVLINVIDASHLERHLYLTTQLLELGKPLIVVLNMTDGAKQQGIDIDMHKLAQQLNCPVIGMQAHKAIGVSALIDQLVCLPAPSNFALDITQELHDAQTALSQHLVQEKKLNTVRALYQAKRILESGDDMRDYAYIIDVTMPYDILYADNRYQHIHTLVQSVQKKKNHSSESITARLDKVVLNRFMALPIFFGVMYAMFLFAIKVGGIFQDFVDISTHTLFVQSSAYILKLMAAPGWVIAFVANGVGVGINTTLTFIPVLAAMFFCLSFLEASGYMARAAFVIDKIMRLLGLPGKAFVPMIVGFGCNVPAIMAARTLDSERDRILTILMSPFMSCSARLAIYTVFVSAFFKHNGQNIVFSLYVIGISLAVLTGFMVRKTMLGGDYSPLILELPAYHLPTSKRLYRDTALRLRHFIWRAGKIILPACILLGGLNALSLSHGMVQYSSGEHSILADAGRFLTPIFYPLGIHTDNWPATVGLLSGTLAKEVVIGTLNTLYTQSPQILDTSSFHFWPSMAEAWHTIPLNIMHFVETLRHPFGDMMSSEPLSRDMYGAMSQHFLGQAGAFAYLLFILLYIPCVSTMAAIRQETHAFYMWFSIIWSFLLAYAVAVGFFQLATWTLHPLSSALWLLGLAFILLLFVLSLTYLSPKNHSLCFVKSCTTSR